MAESKKQKTIHVPFKPVQLGRGEWGSKFYIATFRFPLEWAQGFERRAKSMDFSMASLLSQLVKAFNDATKDPGKSVKLERTAHPTVWGAGTSERKKAAKASKPAKKVKAKTSKPVKKAKTAKTSKKSKAEAAEKLSSAAALLARLKKQRAA